MLECEVCQKVNKEYGTSLTPRTISRYVKEGMAGTSPQKKGPEGKLPRETYLCVCDAFESYVRISQINGDEIDATQKKLAERVNSVVGIDLDGSLKNKNGLINRVLRDTGVPLKAAKSQPVEERRLLWTTWSNLKTWFDSWESDLVSLGFAFKNDEDETIITVDQNRKIFNLDETCLGMDGNKGGRGG